MMPSHPRFAVACAIVLAALLPACADAAPAGHLDPTFGTGGKTTVALPQSVDEGGTSNPGQAVRSAAGQIYLANNPNGGSSSALLQVVRLHHDGTVDAGFGEGGVIETALPDPWQFTGYLTALALQDDGRLIVGLSNPVIVVCRLLPSGALDTAFGSAQTPGCIDLGDSDVNALLVLPDGGIVVAGIRGSSEGRLVRLRPDGTPDESFGDNGSFVLDPIVDTGFNDVALAANGDILAAGWIAQGDYEFLIMRFASESGEPVEEFGDAGAAIVAFDAGSFDHDQASAIAVLPDGGIVAAGYAQTDLQGGVRAAIVKLTDTGARDDTFGPQGKRVIDPCVNYAFGCEMWIHDLAALPDERLVLAGRVSPASYPELDFLALRIRPDGTPDPTFKNGITPGASTVAFNLGQASMWDQASTVLLEGERVLLTGVASVATDDPDNDRYDFALARLDHGKNQLFSVTPAPGNGGSLSPAVPQQVLHSNRHEFTVQPAPGYVVAAIGKATGECGGGMDGEVYVTAPVVAHCTARITFKPANPNVFGDGFE